MNQNHHNHFKVWSGSFSLWLESRCLSWKPDEHIYFGKASALTRKMITMAHLPL